MASDHPRFANYKGLSLHIQYQFDTMHGVSLSLHIQYQFDTMHGVSLSLHIQYQFDTIHGVSKNRIDDTEFLTVSIQEGIQSGLIVSNFLLLTLDDITVALIYNPTYGKYSLFDS